MIYTWIDPWAKWAYVSIQDWKIIDYWLVPQKKWVVQRDVLKEMLSSLKWITYIEKIHALFGSSSKSTFNFWYIFWFMCCALDNPLFVAPKDWQKWVRIDEDIVYKSTKPRKIKDTKATSYNAAKRIFPWESFIPKWRRVPHDWMYDAALIAYRASQQS